MRLIVVLLIALAYSSVAAIGDALPPAIGQATPLVQPIKGEDGIYHQTWFQDTLLDLNEDFNDAKAGNKRLAVIFEQRGCGYCTKMHKEVLAQKYINDYVKQNFHIIQLNMWGSREITDFDGFVLTEKKLAERWGILFTPTIVFFKDDLTGKAGQWGRELEVLRMSLGVGPGTFYDIFTWVRHKVYQTDRNFQRFHLARYEQREALEKAQGNAVETQ